jgi:hypothetical protein
MFRMKMYGMNNIKFIVTRLQAEQVRNHYSVPGRGSEIFFSSKKGRPAVGRNQSPIQWVLQDLSPGVKQPEREAYHLPSSNSKVNNEWSYTSAPPHTPSLLHLHLEGLLLKVLSPHS